MSTPDLTDLVDHLKLVGNRVGKKIDVIGAVSEPPRLLLSMDGASTLDVVVADHDRTLIRHPAVDERSWAEVAGIRFELVAIKKSGDFVTLTFEDAIASALRRHTKRLTIGANTLTRGEIAAKLAREARVPYRVDTTRTEKVHNPVQRSADGQKSDSWEILGTEVAEPVQWRRFSDGDRLVVGSDAWLLSAYKKPVTLREHTGGVQHIDFDADAAKRAQTATFEVDTRLLALRPGAPLNFDQLGPADGLWLVSEMSQPITSPRGTVTATRRQKALKEPKAEKTNKGKGDAGDLDFVPTASGAAGGGVAANAAREKMVRFALAQVGKDYVWGASGPNAYDCSGLVQAATAHAGKVLGKPSASQWGTCRAAGRTISIESALKIRGALLFRVGVGATNHVAISLGNGSTVEARGRAYGCGVFGNAANQGYTGAALWL